MLPLLSDLPTIGHDRPLPLGPVDVHLWSYDHSASTESERSVLLAVLSPDERTRFARLRDDHRRRQFVVGRALCRHVLSRYEPFPPQAWRFALGRRGKPFIAAPYLPSPLWFNLSHTEQVCVCAITRANSEIGLDVERIQSGQGTLGIAREFFPTTEQAALQLVPALQRAETFTQLWALKESFVKATETSLTDGLGGATFDLDRPDHIAVVFSPWLHERAEEWQFNLFGLDLDLVVALALKHPTSASVIRHAATRLTL